MTLASEKYVVLTTFTKNGTPKALPMWPVDAGDGRVGFITSSQTWKVKRILNNAKVQLQPSDSRGRVRDNTEPISGTAEIVSGTAFDAMNARVKKEYGYQHKIINLMHALPGSKLGQPNDRAIVVTLDTT